MATNTHLIQKEDYIKEWKQQVLIYIYIYTYYVIYIDGCKTLKSRTI
jgi:hypothetical protein